MQLRQKAVEQEVDDGHKAGNDDDVARQLDRCRDDLPQEGDHAVGADEDEHGGKPHAQRIDCL